MKKAIAVNGDRREIVYDDGSVETFDGALVTPPKPVPVQVPEPAKETPKPVWNQGSPAKSAGEGKKKWAR